MQRWAEGQKGGARTYPVNQRFAICLLKRRACTTCPNQDQNRPACGCVTLSWPPTVSRWAECCSQNQGESNITEKLVVQILILSMVQPSRWPTRILSRGLQEMCVCYVGQVLPRNLILYVTQGWVFFCLFKKEGQVPVHQRLQTTATCQQRHTTDSRWWWRWSGLSQHSQ